MRFSGMSLLNHDRPLRCRGRLIALERLFSVVPSQSGRSTRLFLAAMCAVSFTLPAWAHHSHGNYTDTFSDMQGVVKEVHLVVPHSWVYVEVKDASGQPQIWALEATGRTGLERIGVSREYIKPGDSVKVRCHPLRDGSRGCLLGFLKARDGSVKDWDGNNAPAPSDF